MTQVAQIFEEEKQQALLQVTRIFEEEKQQALKKATEDFEEEKQQALEKTAKQIVVRMIKKDYSAEEIVSLVPSYSQNDVEALRRELNAAEEKHNTENPQDRA